MNDSRQYDKVDPAALLVAVLAVSITPLIGEGAWGQVPSVCSLVVGIIVFCFTWPHEPQRFKAVDKWIITAQSLVFGLVASVAVAWPIQSVYVFLDFKESNAVYDCILAITPGGCTGRIVNAHYDLWGTLGGFVVGLVVAVVFWFLLFRATKRLVQTTMADERNSFGRNTRIAMKRSRSIRRRVLILARRPRPQQPRS